MLRGTQWAVIAALVTASFAVEALGHTTWSWALDGVAVASYLLFRLLLRRHGRRPRPDGHR